MRVPLPISTIDFCPVENGSNENDAVFACVVAIVGAVYKYDVSLPVQGMYRLVEEVKQRLGGVMLDNQSPSGGKQSTNSCTEATASQPIVSTAQAHPAPQDTSTTSTGQHGDGEGDGILVVGYGHVGDGNLHLNVSAPK